MKTFKLKALEIIEDNDHDIIGNRIPLQDGLIINREDENNTWLIEAYISESYYDYFELLGEEKDEIMIQVKITKKSNAPATFITSIIDLNKIGERMNVLFLGKVIDRRRDHIYEMLTKLIGEGYQGEELVSEFKKLT